MEKKLAKLFSILFHPLLYPAIGLLIIFNSGTIFEFLPFQAKKVMFIIIAISTLVLPLTFVPFFILQKIVKDINMKSHKERLLPFLITSILYFFCFYLLKRLGAPQIISNYILTAAISVFSLFLFSFKWKISAHMSGIGCLTGILIILSFKLNVNLEYYIVTCVFLSGILGFSRLKLKSHEPFEIYIGWLTGIFIPLFVLNIL